MPVLDVVGRLDIDQADVILWTFRGPNGGASEDPNYTGRWVDTTDEVDEALRVTLRAEIERIEEVKEYGLLEENHESSALRIPTDETHAGYVLAECAEEMEGKKSSRLRHIQNSSFYVAKFTWNATVIYGLRKTDSSWRTRRAVNFQALIFQDGQLDVDEGVRFDIARTFDFLIGEDEILCLNKRNFESMLRYKQAYMENFDELKNEEEFGRLFVDLTPLSEYVGNNKIQLRRTSAIREKGHYKDQAFMQRLRDQYGECGLTLEFDEDGRINASVQTCPDIMTALLDHRLASRFSERIYDVPSSTPVQV